MAVAAGLILYLNRGTTFWPDETAAILLTPELGAIDVLDPHSGHLIATSRLAYKAILEAIGAEYVAFRLLGVLSVLLSTALFYALVKRRIGALPALAPTLVLLFLGSGWVHVVVPNGFTVLFSVAAGLAALLALERDDRRGDIASCALLVLSIATYSTGLAFLIGVVVSVLIRPDRGQRAWIFLLPLAIYAAWWLWALPSAGSSEQQTSAANVLLIPSFVADSLAAVTAALAGLGYNFAGTDPYVLDELGWGRILAGLAVVALALRIRQGNLPASLWVSLAIVLTYWTLAALVTGVGTRAPDAYRYIYPGAVGALLVATDAVRSTRFTRVGLAALFAATAFSLGTNLALLRDGAAFFRNTHSSQLRAQFAMLELARNRVDPGFDPRAAVPDFSPVATEAGRYFVVIDRYGSPAFSLSELQRQSESVRQGADQILAAALALGLEPTRADLAAPECTRVAASESGGSVTFELLRGGAVIRARGAAPAEVKVGRFAGFTSADVGSLSPGETAALRIPPDPSPQPWRASAVGASSVTVCPLR